MTQSQAVSRTIVSHYIPVGGLKMHPVVLKGRDTTLSSSDGQTFART
jgi:hypothetical protein